MNQKIKLLGAFLGGIAAIKLFENREEIKEKAIDLYNSITDDDYILDKEVNRFMKVYDEIIEEYEL